VGAVATTAALETPTQEPTPGNPTPSTTTKALPTANVSTAAATCQIHEIVYTARFWPGASLQL
jgi:hypothetical protein